MPRRSTRNAQGGGSIRKRPDGRWEARFTLGRDPGTGKQVQKSVYGQTQAEVRKKLVAATAAVDEGTYIEPSRLTFGQWLDIWTKEYNGSVKERTRQLYEGVVKNRIKPGLGAALLCQLDPITVQRYYNDLLKDGLSAKSVRNIHGIIHKALEQAVKLEYIARNPADGCELPRVEKKEINPFEADALAAFLQAIRDDPFERLFLTALYTGIREGEVLGLPWDAVDFDAGTIRIYQQMALMKNDQGDYERRITDPKNGKPRLFTVAPSVLDILREQRAEQNQWRLIAGPAWENTGLVFTTQLGGMLPRNTVYEHFRVAAAAAGMPDARFHDLRHTFAVVSLESGVSVKTLQEALGHATAAFTLDIYGHVSQRMQQDSARKMEAFIQRMAKK